MGKKKTPDELRPADPETEEKKRLRSLAVSQRLLRHSPANPSNPLQPSKSVLKLDGRDIAKRGQRRSRYLFSFPGLLAPLSGGKVGELADLATKNPKLYLEFPQVISDFIGLFSLVLIRGCWSVWVFVLRVGWSSLVLMFIRRTSIWRCSSRGRQREWCARIVSRAWLVFGGICYLLLWLLYWGMAMGRVRGRECHSWLPDSFSNPKTWIRTI